MARKRNTGAFVMGSLIGGLAGAALTLWKTPKSGTEMRQSMGLGGDAQTRTLSTGETTTASGERSFSNPVLSFVEKVTAPIPGVELGKLAKDDPAAASPMRSSAADARPPGSTFDPLQPERGTAMATTDTIETPAGERVQPVAGEPLTAPTEPVDETESTNTAGETLVYRSGTSATASAPVGGTAAPSEETTHDAVVGSDAPAASVDDLTHSAPGYTGQHAADRERETATSGDYAAVNPDEEATHDPVEGSEAHTASTEDLTHPTPEYAEQLEEQPANPDDVAGDVEFPEPPSRDTTR